MIKTIEDAKSHCSHVNPIRHTHLVVVSDGSIYTSNDSDKMQSLIDNNSCFVIKGGLTKTIKATKKKEITV
jgi:Fe2+ or Zn2+ uptake regulation protein